MEEYVETCSLIELLLCLGAVHTYTHSGEFSY